MKFEIKCKNCGVTGTPKEFVYAFVEDDEINVYSGEPENYWLNCSVICPNPTCLNLEEVEENTS